LVEIEVHKSEACGEKASTTSLDVNELVGKIRDFVGNIKEMSPGGEPMAVSVEAFNVSVGKLHEEYTLGVQLSLVLKPKAPAPIAAQPF
jgi:hypothetical protein